MVIEPRVMGNICLTAHPIGLKKAVEEQIEWTKKQPKIDMPKKVLVLGGSTGYGLSTRIAAAFAGGADSICVSFEKEPSEKRTGTPGWYNNRAFSEMAEKEGLIAENINADAFSHETKELTIAKIKALMGKVDMVCYSLASPVRTDPDTGEMYKSVLKPLGETFTNNTVDFMKEQVKEVSIEPAKEGEVEPTVKVMGGEDWKLWIDALKEAGVLADGVITMAYDYIGPEITFPVYRHGTIGKAKEHLEATGLQLNEELADINGRAFVSVNKAVVTRASAMIPVVPLYIAILFRIMKKKGNHEGCMEQMYRMLHDKVYGKDGIVLDELKLCRMDDWEMADDIQEEVMKLWSTINNDNLVELTDIRDFKHEYLVLHGFDVEGVDYSADVPTIGWE